MSTTPVYENNEYLNMYLGLHYPKSGIQEGVEPILPHANAPIHGLNFPQRMVEILNSLQDKRGRALDVGCAVGGTAFELGRFYDHVEAFDFR